MRLPPEPKFIPIHRHAGRFWDTHEMIEAISIYYGSTPNHYPRSWQYRTLIAAHREQYSQRTSGKGYGKDWQDNIKPGVVEYTKEGKLPLVSLKHAAELIRQAETLAWAIKRAAQATVVVPFKPALRVARNK